MESLGCATETNRNSNLQHGSRWKIELKLGLYFHNTVVSLFSITFIVNWCFLRTARLSSTTVHHISTSSEKGERSWEEVTLEVWLPVTHKHICVSWVILCQVYVQQHEYVTHDIWKSVFFSNCPQCGEALSDDLEHEFYFLFNFKKLKSWVKVKPTGKSPTILMYIYIFLSSWTLDYFLSQLWLCFQICPNTKYTLWSKY